MDHAGIEALERAGFVAWPAHVTLDAGGWLVRVSGGGSKRANSANALPGALPVAAVLLRIEAIYRDARLPVIFRLTPLTPAGADTALETAGHDLEQPSWVMTGPTTALAMAEALRIEAAPSPDWLAGIADMDGAKANPEHERIARSIRLPAAFATLMENDVAVAHGLAVADGGFVGLFDIVVAPGARGRGLGRTLTQGLVAWGANHGAKTAWLQVRDGNTAARALYRSLGFVDAYPYHYRVREQT
jgi:ribosomal protein S18 acetylase RimI-like enzyme